MYSIVKYQPSEYGSYRFPAWAELLGILMGLLSCLMIPAGMLLAVLRQEGSLWEVSLPSMSDIAFRVLALPWTLTPHQGIVGFFSLKRPACKRQIRGLPLAPPST